MVTEAKVVSYALTVNTDNPVEIPVGSSSFRVVENAGTIYISTLIDPLAETNERVFRVVEDDTNMDTCELIDARLIGSVSISGTIHHVLQIMPIPAEP